MDWMLSRCIVLALCLLWAAGSALAAGSTAAETHIDVRSWIEPSDQTATIETIEALDQSHWQTYADRHRFGYIRNAVWFRIQITLPEQDHNKWVIEFADPLIDSLEVYLPDPTSPKPRWRLVQMGDHLPFSNRPLPSRNFALPLPREAGSILLFARVSTETSLQLPIKVLTDAALIRADTQALVLEAGYVGLMGGLLLYNLLLLLRTHETVYIYYAGWLFSITSFVLGINGLTFQYLWPDRPEWNNCSILLSLLCSTFLLGAFWSRTLGRHINGGVLPNALVILSLMIPAAILVCSLPYALAIQLTIVFTLSWAIALVWQAVLASQRGFKELRSLLTAFVPLLAAGIVLALERFGVLDPSPLGLHAVAAGSALQAIMMSVMLGDRLSRLRELNSAAVEMQRFNQSLEASNAALGATNAALKEALKLSEARSRSIAQMKEKLRRAAEERNTEKSKFLAQAVHDLKQPLQAISIAVTPIQSLLERTPNRQVEELIDVVIRAAKVMRNQVSGLLDLSRLESGFIRPQPERIRLRAFIKPLLDPLETFSRDLGVEMEVFPDEGEAVHVCSDPNLLRQILTNLISNAVKYADPAKAPHCKVSISWRIQAHQVCITVADNGVGIDPQHLADRAIFQPFFQINNTLSEGEKGVGLGLSIVSAALALMPDHAIGVESCPGEGSTFTLTVPRADGPTDAGEILALQQESELTDLAGKYVVLVDDDLLIRRSIVALFDHHNILHDEFCSAADLASRMATLERLPDVLLSDYRLPDNKTALDVMALMSEVWPHVPTVVVTGDAAAAATLSERSDVVGVLHKPVSPTELLYQLGRACKIAQRTDMSECD